MYFLLETDAQSIGGLLSCRANQGVARDDKIDYGYENITILLLPCLNTQYGTIPSPDLIKGREWSE